MALNLSLASAVVKLTLEKTQFEAGIAGAITRLNSLRGLGSVPLVLNRSQADASLAIFDQRLRAARTQARINVTLDRSRADASLSLLEQHARSVGNAFRFGATAAGGVGGGTGTGRGSGGGGGVGFLGGAGRIAAGIAINRAINAAVRAPGDIAEKMFDAAKSAADLGESISKVQVTFGPSAQTIIGKSDELAERFGVVRRESLDAAAAFGLMGQASGMTKDKSADLGAEFVQMGLDLASFHNISNELAFEKLRSGLAGEIEPLRQIGILLSDDALKARALANGMAKTKAEASRLTQQQKVQLRVELIREGMGPAAGDLERTAESSANQLRKLQGDMANAAVEFGKQLQGALSDGMKLAREIGAIIQGWTGKDAPKLVGEVTQAGVNAVRTVASGGGPSLMDRMSLGLGQAESALFAKMGLGANFMGVKDSVDKMQREQEGAVAAASGQSLTAGPATTEDRVKALRASKDPAQIARADEIEAVTKGFAEAVKPRDLGIGALPKGLDDLAGAQARDRAQEERNRLDAGAIFARPSGAAPAPIGELSAFARQFRDKDEVKEFDRLEKEKERKKAFQSQHFSGGDDFATSFIQSILSGKDDTPKLTLEEQKKANEFHKQMVEKIDKFLPEAMRQTNNGPLFMRGRA